jgi:drug/metabolite transporter (DMT)-like permease
MGVVAPIAAVLTAAIPVAYGAIDEGIPKKMQLAGFAIALISIWMVSRPEPETGSRNGLLLAMLSGIGFGAYLIFIRKSGTHDVFWPLAIARGSSSVSIFLVFSALRKFRFPARRDLPVTLLAGALDAGGIALFLIGARMGRLDIMAVLSSMYPAVTVVLARLWLDEELRRLQIAGIVAALLSVALIAL